MAVGIWFQIWGAAEEKSRYQKIGFCPGNVQERLTRGMQQTTGLMVGYEIMKVSRLLSGEDLVRYGGDYKIYLFMDREPVETGQEPRCGK